jgi:hypothetical protein
VGYVFGEYGLYLCFGRADNGDLCGVDDFEDSKYTVYPRAVEDYLINAGIAASGSTDFKFYGICASECPSRGDVVCNYDAGEGLSTDEKMSCIWSEYRNTTGIDCTGVSDGCWVIGQDTESVAFRCVPVFLEKELQGNDTTCSYPGVNEIGRTLDRDDPGCLVISWSASSLGATSRSGTSSRCTPLPVLLTATRGRC